MEFNIKDKHRPLPRGYSTEDITDAKAVTLSLAEQFPFIKAGMLSRWAVKDILPLYLYIDDVTHKISEKDIHEYVHAARSVITKHNPNIQVHPMRLTEHWQKFTDKDQNYLNIIRYGVTVYDQGFIEPVANLLAEGRIRPSKEALGVYYSRTNITMRNARNHILQAAIDCYWAAMDAAHAAVMNTGKMPPSPSDMAEVLENTFVQRNLLEAKYPQILRKLYELHKQIERRQLTEISGREWQTHHKDASSFVKRIEKLLT
ncbi:MAG: hypothetical protein ACE5FT_06165 [Candidatus Nanoarchaeia archaeon]